MRSTFRGTERYRLIRKLGEGGMGIVYEVDDTVRGERVALKTLKNLDPNMIYRLKHEFRALAELSHRNLIALHELVVDGDMCFFTMELLEGKDLLTYVKAAASVAPESIKTALEIQVPSSSAPTDELGQPIDWAAVLGRKGPAAAHQPVSSSTDIWPKCDENGCARSFPSSLGA